MNFDEAFDLLMVNEGGYSNDKHDPGGETSWGISKRAYPDVDIKALTREGAAKIYFRDYWKEGKLDLLPPALAFQVFDAAVNHGQVTARKMLQRAAGVKDDGVIGPVTLKAITCHSEASLIMLFIAERIDLWTGLPTWKDFGRGWARRAADNLRLAASDAT